MTDRPTVAELKRRIQADESHFGGKLPERTALVWYGYIGSLLEWGLLSVDDHKELCRLLPQIEDNPMTDIFLGRED